MMGYAVIVTKETPVARIWRFDKLEDAERDAEKISSETHQTTFVARILCSYEPITTKKEYR